MILIAFGNHSSSLGMIIFFLDLFISCSFISSENDGSLDKNKILSDIKISFLKSNEYDHERFEIISSSLSIHYQKASRDIGKIIGCYEYKNPHDKLYEKIMNKLNALNVIEEENKGERNENQPLLLCSLDFYKRDFLGKIHQILIGKEWLFGKFNLFWYDLLRLVFKWTIHMKQQETLNDENEENEESKSLFQKTLNPIIMMINENTTCLVINPSIFDLNDFQSNSAVYILSQLTICEISSRPNIISLFQFIIFGFYQGLFNCEELKRDYFDGNFNSNILLKIMIYLYDPIGQLKNCLLSLIQCVNSYFPLIASDSSLSFKAQEGKRDQKAIICQSHEKDGINNLFWKFENFRIFDMNLVTISVIKFYLSINQKFKILFSSDLVSLLKKLKKSGLLKKRLLERIIKFDTGHEYLWDQKKFLEHLNRQWEMKLLAIEDYSEYINLLMNE